MANSFDPNPSEWELVTLLTIGRELTYWEIKAEVGSDITDTISLLSLNESLYKNLLDVETKNSQFNCDELFLLNEKLRNNIESFLPEKNIK